jgi:hypothetical protein
VGLFFSGSIVIFSGIFQQVPKLSLFQKQINLQSSMDPQVYRSTGGKGGKGKSGGKGLGKGGKSGGKSQGKAAPTSRASKAGLQFPVGRIHRYLKGMHKIP